MPPPPIILIHRGDSFYLAHTIAQARSSNPESRLILLGDRCNSFYLGVEHHRYEDYFEEAREFAQLFTYEYFPTYQYPWILFCHQKYFALRDFIRAEGIEKFLLIDSDVLLYEPIHYYFDFYRDYRMTVSASTATPAAQAAFALVNDPSVITDLCLTYHELFRNRPKALFTRFRSDCITEMAGLFVLMSDAAGRIKNTYKDDEDFVINHNLLDDPRLDRTGDFCAISWQGSLPMFRTKATGTMLRSPIIHFHGHAKKHMGKHLRLTNTRVRLEHLVNRGMHAAAKYPMRWVNRLTGHSLFPGL
jgi:hypothetical protein